MVLLPADYALGALVIVLTVAGLFRGFSGTLAFVVATAVAALTATFGWPLSETYAEALWARGGLTLTASLVAFGLTRLVVKRLVNGLLAQPTDALFGGLVGLAAGLAVIAAWSFSGFHTECSNLAQLFGEVLGERRSQDANGF